MGSCDCSRSDDDDDCKNRGDTISGLDSERGYKFDGHYICYKRSGTYDYYDIIKSQYQYKKDISCSGSKYGFNKCGSESLPFCITD